MGPSATVDMLRVDATARTKVIDGAIAQLDSFYVFPEVAKRIGDSLRTRSARGAYDTYANGISFSMKLNDEVRALSHDKHMRRRTDREASARRRPRVGSHLDTR